MVFDWVLNKLQAKTDKMQVEDIQDYLNILKETSEEDRGIIIVWATVSRLKWNELGTLPEDIFDGPAGRGMPNGYERSQVALSLCRLAETFQKSNQFPDATATTIWLHSVRGLLNPQLVPFVKEMWKELSKGFPYAIDVIPQFEMITDTTVPPNIYSHLHFIPSQFK